MLCRLKYNRLLDKAACIDGSVVAFFLTGFESFDKEFALHKRLAPGESYSASVTEENFVPAQMNHKLINRVFSAAQLSGIGRTHLLAHSAAVA